MIAKKVPLPIDERAIRALEKKLSEIKLSNNYYVQFNRIRRLKSPAQLDTIREPPELHIVPGHVIRDQLPSEQIYRRGGAFEFWFTLPVTLLFYSKISTKSEPEFIYRLFKTEILRCVLGGDIVDQNNYVYPVYTGPAESSGPYVDNVPPISCTPLFASEINDYVAGAIELYLLATFSDKFPYVVDGDDTAVFVEP